MLTEQIEHIILGYTEELKKSGLHCFQYVQYGSLYINSSVIPGNKRQYIDFVAELITMRILSEGNKRIFTKHDFISLIKQLENDFKSLLTLFYPSQCAIDSLYMIADKMQ